MMSTKYRYIQVEIITIRYRYKTSGDEATKYKYIPGGDNNN